MSEEQLGLDFGVEMWRRKMSKIVNTFGIDNTAVALFVLAITIISVVA